MDDTEKRVCKLERKVAVLKAQRAEDQGAIKLLREGKQDRTGTIISVIAALLALASILLRGH